MVLVTRSYLRQDFNPKDKFETRIKNLTDFLLKKEYGLTCNVYLGKNFFFGGGKVILIQICFAPDYEPEKKVVKVIIIIIIVISNCNYYVIFNCNYFC
jgi:hypothetical protein